MQAQTIEIGSQTIAFYQSAGEGPAVLLVHGNSASGLTYRRQLESSLGQKYRLIAIDLPGHGQSTPAADPASAYTIPGYANVIVQAAEQLGLHEGAVIIGWSLGGHAVLEASLQLPKAAGFMVFGTPPLAFPPAMDQAFLPNPAMNSTFKADLSEDEMNAFAAAFFAPGADVPGSLKADIRRTDGRARETLGGSIRPGGYADEIEIVAKLSAPLAILHGEQEQLINASYISGLNMPTLWRGAIQTIPNAGHAPHWEQAEQFNALLEAFIDESST